MANPFDSDSIAGRGWRQGAILGDALATLAGGTLPRQLSWTVRTDWAGKRTEIEEEVTAFWTQFRPGIECVGVEVLGTDEITLADIEPYQRFDADWVSFEDDTPVIPPVIAEVS